VLDPEVRLVEAGPGSGKTRALVARFLQTSRSTTRGVALLSFTNAAIDEVRRRTAGSPGAVSAPNFVGTIDSFLNRFIVTPAEVPRLGRQPTYRPSWDDLPSGIRVLRLAGISGQGGVPLAAFRKSADGSFVVNENQLKQPERLYLESVDAADRRLQLVNRATGIINGLNEAGHYDAHTARLRAFEILRSHDGDAIVRRLSKRFAEVLLDEAQDCDAAEFGVLQLLAPHTRTVLVADPDQAIFAFRGSNPQLFLDYRDSLPAEQKTSLGDNHRSTPEICGLTSSLRTGGQAAVVAVSQDPGPPVYVVKGSASDQRHKFLTVLDEHEIDPSDAIVLSHSLARARSVAGVDDPAANSVAAGNRLASACWVLRQHGNDARTRLDAVSDVEEIILSLATWPVEVERSDRSGKLDHAKKDPQWLRRSAGSLISSLSAVTDRAEFGAVARSRLEPIVDELGVGHVSLGPKVQQPDAATWGRSSAAAINDARLQYDTVHGAKGTEAPAVLLSLPAPLQADDAGRTVLDDWATSTSSERLRVLYVGVSRAQRLICLGVTNTKAAAVVANLSAAGIPREIR